MNPKHVISRVILRAAAVLAIIVLSGCSLPLQATTVPPTQDMKPTFDAVAAEAVQTVVAQITQSAPTAAPATATTAPTNTPAFTDTPVPTFTPAPPTATPTNTFIPWTNTPRATATYAYSCRIIEQGPAYGDDFPKRAPFDGRWKVKNTSSDTWYASQVDFKYLSGTKFQDDVDTLDLKSDVAKDGEYTVIIDMTAPDTAGRYTATWGFVQGGTILCAVNVTIDVKP